MYPTRFTGRGSPEKIASHLRDSAASGSSSIKNFKRAFHSEEMRTLFQTVHSADFPQGQDMWQVDYIDSIAKFKQSHPTNQNGSSDVPKSEAHDVSAVLEAFKSANPTINVNTPSGPDQLPLVVVISSLTFRIDFSSTELSRYEVRAGKANKVPAAQMVILKHLQTDHASSDLADLLTLLASYQGYKSQTCDKCHSIFDASLSLPINRRKAGTPEALSSNSWVAIHQSCS